MMVDYFQSSPNFVNPSYASPEQLATQRAYAEALTKQSGENVNRPAGAIANMLNALTANLQRNNANALQQQTAQSNASDASAIIDQLQRGVKPDANTMGHFFANPGAFPEARALIGHLVNMQATQDVAGRPAFQSPATGVVGAPITGAFEPGLRTGVSAGDTSVTTAPIPAPPFPGAPARPAMAPGMSPTGPRPPVASSPTVWGDKEAVAAGLYPPSAPQAAGSGGGGSARGAGPPPAPAPASALPPQVVGTMQQLGGISRDLNAQKTFTQGGADAVTNFKKADLAAANDAPVLKTIVGTMLDDVQTHGKDWTMGPSADVSMQIKKLAANYAPGVMKDQLEKIASAESFSKMSATLAGMTGSSGNTDAQLVNRIQSNPGMHNTVGGATGLLQMRLQLLNQQQELVQATAPARNAEEYTALKKRFFEDPANRIKNPITGHPISVDMANNPAAASDNGGFKVLKVH